MIFSYKILHTIKVTNVILDRSQNKQINYSSFSIITWITFAVDLWEEQTNYLSDLVGTYDYTRIQNLIYFFSPPSNPRSYGMAATGNNRNTVKRPKNFQRFCVFVIFNIIKIFIFWNLNYIYFLYGVRSIKFI